MTELDQLRVKLAICEGVLHHRTVAHSELLMAAQDVLVNLLGPTVYEEESEYGKALIDRLRSLADPMRVSY